MWTEPDRGGRRKADAEAGTEETPCEEEVILEEDDDDEFDKDEEDDDDEEVNPALSKVMMALGYRRFHYTGCDYFLYYRSCGRLLWWQRQSFWSQERRVTYNGI